MKKLLLLALLGCLFFAVGRANAGLKDYDAIAKKVGAVPIAEYTGDLEITSPIHAAVIMSASGVGSGDGQYEGVAFPLFCGILSIYPEEDTVVFTKMTKLPIIYVDHILSRIEEKTYMLLGHEVLVPARHIEFYSMLQDEARRWYFGLYTISHARKAPLNYRPKFTRTSRYSKAKNPPTKYGYDVSDIEKVYTPMTYEELAKTKKRPANPAKK